MGTLFFLIFRKEAIFAKAFNFALALAQACLKSFSKLSFASIVTLSDFLLELFSIFAAPIFTCTYWSVLKGTLIQISKFPYMFVFI